MSQLAQLFHKAFASVKTLDDYDSVDEQLRLAAEMGKLSDDEAAELEDVSMNFLMEERGL